MEAQAAALRNVVERQGGGGGSFAGSRCSSRGAEHCSKGGAGTGAQWLLVLIQSSRALTLSCVSLTVTGCMLHPLRLIN